MNYEKRQAKKKHKMSNGGRSFIVQWDNRFPLDYWWRKKYNVPFGSAKHREMSFIDMYLEWEEERWINDLKNKSESEDEDWKRDENVVNVSQEEIDRDFESLNLEEFK